LKSKGEIEEISLYCKHNGINLQRVFVDEGYSASNVKRPGFQNLLTEISNPGNKVSFLIIRDSARLIRNLTLKRSIYKVFKKFGIKLVILSHDIDDSTPDGEFQVDFIALMDENELKRVSPRTLKGLRGSALMGNYTYGGPHTPRGYVKVPNKRVGKGFKLKINEDEVEWIKFIFEVLSTNRMTSIEMIKYLKKNKVFNIKWNREALYKIIDNPIYYGRFSTSYFDSETETIGEEYKMFWYDHEHHTQPMVSKELWMATQSAVHHYKRLQKHKYLFSRLVYCVDTNEFMVNESAWKKQKNGEKVLYLYYYSPTLKKRINQNKITEKFEIEYSYKCLDLINKKIYTNLKNNITNKIRRREILEEDFDNGLIDEVEYREKVREINLGILDNKKKLNNLKDTNVQFSEMTYEKKKAIILSNVKRVDISLKNNTIDFTYIDKYNYIEC